MEQKQSIQTYLNFLRKIRSQCKLSTTEQALYMELVCIAAGQKWPAILQCSNKVLCDALGLNVKTLQKSREILVQNDLIKFGVANSKKSHSIYELLVVKNTMNNNTFMVKNTTNSQVDTILYNNTKVLSNNNNAGALLGSKKSKLKSSKKTGEKIAEKTTIKSVENNDQNGGKIFTDAIATYDNFIKTISGHGAKIDGAQGKALKSILAYLRTQVRAKTPDMTLEIENDKLLHAWDYVLKSYSKWSSWQQSRTTLVNINSELQNILTAIKQQSNGNSISTKTGAPASKMGTRGGTLADLEALKSGGSTANNQPVKFTDITVLQ